MNSITSYLLLYECLALLQFYIDFKGTEIYYVIDIFKFLAYLLIGPVLLIAKLAAMLADFILSDKFARLFKIQIYKTKRAKVKELLYTPDKDDDNFTSWPDGL